MPFADRIARVQKSMHQRDVDALLLSVGADLPYLTGYRATPLERLTMLVVGRSGRPTLLVPRLEAARVEPQPGVFMVEPWDEKDDPLDRVAELIGDGTDCLIGDQTWARFLLGLQERLPGAAFNPATPLMAGLRMRKGAAEIAALRGAAEAADRVVERLADMRLSGRTELDVAHFIHDALLEEGCDTASFAAIVGSGPNAASPHHEPTGRTIIEGDTVVIDFGGQYRGYCSDTTRTFSVGAPQAEASAAFAVLQEAQMAAVDAVHPGARVGDVDRAARTIIADAGFGPNFLHRTGHGIGLEVHEDPYITEGGRAVLEPGMTFSVEPGIYFEGRFGVRIEDIVVVTEEGVDRLNRSDRRLYVVA